VGADTDGDEEQRMEKLVDRDEEEQAVVALAFDAGSGEVAGHGGGNGLLDSRVNDVKQRGS